MKAIRNLFFLFLVLCSFEGFSQQKAAMKTVYYEIKNVTTQQQVDELKAAVQQFKYVTKVDAVSNLEDGLAGLTVYVSETIVHEGDGSFDQAGVKKLIIAKGMIPAKLKVEEIK